MPKFWVTPVRYDMPTGIKINGAPLKLTFGSLRKASGRMMGIGLDMKGRKTLFQQHYHQKHEAPTSDDIGRIFDGQFHYHVKVWGPNNQGP
jgi:hypothetical protein